MHSKIVRVLVFMFVLNNDLMGVCVNVYRSPLFKPQCACEGSAALFPENRARRASAVEVLGTPLDIFEVWVFSYPLPVALLWLFRGWLTLIFPPRLETLPPDVVV
jgi:hypothetical protein